ncbi:MAG: Hsp20/alpha crystallin family protein [Deltaproteobacteria bacterium]|nr:Hsp20/alpha crystallin family protein [Deltaproteobacteria bacterium]MCB9785767.1 Hsp20/alpha crystallin family protein [Deltaproteobacteria bacterium]
MLTTHPNPSPQRKDDGMEQTRERPTVAPLVDVYENDSELLLIAELAGATRESVDLNLEEGALTLSATRERTVEGAILGDEIGDADYRRSFRLPRGLDLENVSAELDHGTLRIHLPKAKEFQPRQIAITSA